MSDRPVYLRLRDLIVAAILDGTYRDGDALPSVRSLAAEHGANPLTVAKAYQTFQDERLITVRRGIGMFVAPGARNALLARERQAFMDQEWPAILSRMRSLGLDLTDLTDRVEA